ncbi:MAG: 2,3-bisphosphoglycerate-independent phosphoglycerate mutase [Gammaproteobacteria bacterium]|nr:2,3-bisphosphoglycerate-independent phosphoglycerate mutase [Gammaproteobacteria bacterium]
MSQTTPQQDQRRRPTVLVILDGWGYSENPQDNAIYSANTPVWDRLWQDNPHCLIHASGEAVGLPAGQMGNSEVGHLNLGAGRVVYQDLSRIELAIKDRSFYDNPVLTGAVDKAVATGKALHLLGLLSPGGVHSHEKQIEAMVELASQRGVSRLYLHAFLDGRDCPPQSAADSIAAMEACFARYGTGRFASVIGRYYAMDRDHRWPRIRSAYELITQGKAEFTATSAQHALQMAYQRDETDEFVKATSISAANGDTAVVEDGDVVVMMNFRSDRARQITRAFVDEPFEGFERHCRPALGEYVCLTEYSSELALPVAFPSPSLHNTFGEYIAKHGKRQLRIAETEKYAHVTFFFNGGEERPSKGEERTLVPSPQVSTYDLQPEMNAPRLTDELVAAIESGDYDAIICNFANPDMVGHTGKLDAAIKAIETLDSCLARVCTAMRAVSGDLLITADHGNAEQLRDEVTGQPHTAHTCNLVPLIYVGATAHMSDKAVNQHGALQDIAPTLLYLMALDKPQEMSGESLLQLA